MVLHCLKMMPICFVSNLIPKYPAEQIAATSSECCHLDVFPAALRRIHLLSSSRWMLDPSSDTVRCSLVKSLSTSATLIYDLKTLKWRRLISAGGNIKKTINKLGETLGLFRSHIQNGNQGIN